MNIYLLLPVVLSAFSSLIAVQWVYFKTLKIAKEKNLVDNPGARKLQKNPIPVVGGIAVFFGVVFGLLVGMMMHHVLNVYVPVADTFLISTTLLPVVLAMVIMLYTGAMDDILGLTPNARFVIEIIVILGIVLASGGCIDSFHGMWGVEELSWYVAIPLTVFSGVGIINAVNMVDGVNGLSSGLCITCCILFGFAFVVGGDVANAVLAFSMATALLPFFIHNVFGNTSRMFIGDAGTMVMGVLMSWFVISVMRNDSCLVPYNGRFCMAAFVVAVLALPIADTIRVMVMRMFRGRSPFTPDKTHLHHAFVSMGISHSITALSEICINFFIVGVWLVTAYCLKAPLHCQLYTVIIVAAILVWGTYAFLAHEKNSNSRKAQWLRRFSIRTHLGRTEWWQRLTHRLDAPEFEQCGRKNTSEHLERKFVNKYKPH